MRSQENAHLGSWELDLQNNHLSWSDEVYRIFGLQSQEFDATYEAFLDAIHPDDRASVDEAYSGSLREEKDKYEIEHRVVRKSTGEIRIVHEKCEHYRDENGEIIRSVGMVHDITEQKRAEEVLERSMKELKRSNQELEQFAYVSSHDLQEPLRMVSSFAQLLERRYKGRFDEDADEYIGFIVEGAHRMKDLIDDLLAFSRINTHANKFESVNLANVLDTVHAHLSVSIEENNASITHDPLPIVRANPSQIMQVLQNLISNAIKFNDKEKPEIHISAQETGDEQILE